MESPEESLANSPRKLTSERAENSIEGSSGQIPDQLGDLRKTVEAYRAALLAAGVPIPQLQIVSSTNSVIGAEGQRPSRSRKARVGRGILIPQAEKLVGGPDPNLRVGTHSPVPRAESVPAESSNVDGRGHGSLTTVRSGDLASGGTHPRKEASGGPSVKLESTLATKGPLKEGVVSGMQPRPGCRGKGMGPTWSYAGIQ